MIDRVATMIRMSRCTRHLRLALHRWFIWPYRTVVTEDPPLGRLKSKTLYIVEAGGWGEHLAMLCPCGCRSVLELNLIPDEHPCWRFNQHSDGTLSLYPSVRRRKGCRAHFWIWNGRIHWCADVHWWMRVSCVSRLTFHLRRLCYWVGSQR